MSYFVTKYASPSLAENVKLVIGLLQLPVTAIIVAISVEDSAAKRVRILLQDEEQRKHDTPRKLDSGCVVSVMRFKHMTTAELFICLIKVYGMMALIQYSTGEHHANDDRK